VTAAAERLAGFVNRTPLLESMLVNRQLGGRLLLKAESLQQTGSFKIRGASNRLLQLDAGQRQAGVVAFSSGNHAQGVAAAAQRLGMPATIVMPRDAPAIKVANTRAYGATVVLYDRWTESREAIAARLCDEQGATLVPPFDDPRVIAGQGTVGLEIAEQCAMRGVVPDELVVTASGGGLVAGCALAVEGTLPHLAIYTAEPRDFNDHERSLAAGKRIRNGSGAHSFCDALLAPEPGEITFAINRERLAGGVSVSDAEVARAIAFAAQHFKLVLEPGGAVALAAVLAGRRKLTGRAIVVVCSGGNVDLAVFHRCLDANAGV
jgi:threonine dehydratase